MFLKVHHPDLGQGLEYGTGLGLLDPHRQGRGPLRAPADGHQLSCCVVAGEARMVLLPLRNDLSLGRPRGSSVQLASMLDRKMSTVELIL